jgi:hypothetical protein
MPLRVLTLCVAVLLSPLASLAQPLADRVPGDAIVYVGWTGADSMGPSYAKSHLKAVLDAANVSKLVDEFLPRAFERMAQAEPGAREGMAGLSASGHTWRHPTAFYFTGVDANVPGGPQPKFTLVCRAGKDADAMHAQLQEAFGGAPAGPWPARVFRSGEFVGITNDGDRNDAAVAALGANSLAANARFKAAISKAMREPALAAYVDAEALTAVIDKLVQAGGDPQAAATWPKVREATGLAGLKRVIWTQGFDGADWGTQVFLEAPSPRKGLLAMLDAKPLGDDVLKVIPVTATMAGVSRFDPGGLLDGIRAAAATIEPGTEQHFDQVLAQVSQMLGMDVRKDFLGALGDEWAYYVDPMTGGRGGMGFVFVNRLRDEAKAGRALKRLCDVANQLIAQQTGGEVTIAARQTRAGDVTINYLAVPFLTPSWAVHEGNLYIAMYPQVVASAVRQAGAPKSILDNKDFVALRQRLAGGSAKPSSVQFMDLQKTAPGGYQAWLMLSSFAKFGDVFGVESPAMLFPTLDVLMQHLAPAGSVSWADDSGWHLRGVSPFPLSTIMAADTGGSLDVQSTATMISILLPSLNRAREQANRVKSASNLRMIAQVTMMHANENKGRFPDDIADLLKQDLPADAFSNPRGNASTPPAGASPEELAQWVRESSDYVYLGKGKNYRTPADFVLAYEKPDGLQDGINVAFVDGRVVFVKMDQATKLIQAGRGSPE